MERAIKLLVESPLAETCLSDEVLARAAWAKAVGKKIADHSMPMHMVRDRLVVDVDDEIWKKQLTPMSGQIVDRLNQVIGRAAVRDIQFRTGAKRRGPGSAAFPVRPAAQVHPDGIKDPILGRLYRARLKKGTA
ncbi:MAG: DUF721 domain-containing protein [Acidobacteria bacterium]|nr:DUF721 domain-containing protein [Acidobacteriota bacterium]